MTTEIIEPQLARMLLKSDEFLSAWSQLWSASANATRFQSPEFAVTWYERYADRFDPVLVIARDPSGRLVGLLPLAWSRKENIVGAAGLWQSEYQGWIAIPAVRERFESSALALVARRFPSSTIRFKYCLHPSPIDRVTPAHLRNRLRITRRQRPIVWLDGEIIAQSFRKSGNKNRMRQLRKIGEIEFRRITDPVELERMFDEIVAQHDARRLACTGRRPFALDPRKKALYLSLMKVPGLLHVTVLTVGGKLASAQLNVRESDHVQLHLLTHSAEFAKHSPGKLHIMLLSQMLLSEGCRYIDLTPGDEIFKKRAADENTDVHELTIHPSRLARRAAATYEVLRGWSKRLAQRVGVRPALARTAVKRMAFGELGWKLKTLLKSAGRWIVSREQLHVFSFGRDVLEASSGNASGESSGESSGASSIHGNCVEDLMAYQPAAGAPPSHRFIASALAQIEAGGRWYTRVENGRLESAARTSLLPLSCLASGGCVLIEELLAGSTEKSAAIAPALLQAILADVRNSTETGRVFLAVRSSCSAMLTLARSMQFQPEYCIADNQLFGKKRRRIVCLETKPAPTAPLQHPIDVETCPSLEEAML